MNVFARFDEMSSLPVENIKEKPKRHGRMERRMDRQMWKQYTPPSLLGV